MKNCEVIAIANQKSGVGKTTTTFSLGVALANMGKKVLLVDADPQGDLTTYAGWHNTDDIYDGDYSLTEMLKNYNVITLGKKELDSHMTQSNFSKGDARLFHINSRFLINGNLSIFRADLLTNSDNLKSYTNTLTSENYMLFCGYDGRMSDMDNSSNCGVSSPYVSDNMPNKLYTSSAKSLYVNTTGKSNRTSSGNYMNFDRLYDSIIEEQNNITRGKKLDESKDTLHINIGGEYYIDDISNVKDIIFDNFENNGNELTVITVNNSEIDEFPQLFRSDASSNYNIIPTNDYIGMTRPNNFYANYYVIDSYYGNIIWNFPNANYIRFNSGVPIVGHIVAPKADIESTKEFHIAGSILANSVYFKGYSEAHFYPLVIEDIPYGNDPEPIDEPNIPSAKEQVVTNPNTKNNLIVISLITILSFIFVLKNVNKKKID